MQSKLSPCLISLYLAAVFVPKRPKKHQLYIINLKNSTHADTPSVNLHCHSQIHILSCTYIDFECKFKIGFVGRAGGRVVRAHAIYTADPGSNPDWRSFAACHPPLSPMFPVDLLININKILKKKKKLVLYPNTHSKSLALLYYLLITV